jgi:hypothetical protein
MAYEEVSQGAVYCAGGRRVGIVEVSEVDGAPRAILAVFDPTTKEETDVEVRVGDVVRLGSAAVKIVELAVGQAHLRGHVGFEPVEG